MKRKKTLILGVAVFVALVGWISARRYDGFSWDVEICTTCGCERVRDKIFWIERSSIRETGLSRFYKQRGRTPEHTHQWLYASGGGPGICSIGNGSSLISAIHDDKVPGSLELIRSEIGQDAAFKWFQRLLNPTQSINARNSITAIDNRTGEFQATIGKAETSFTFLQSMTQCKAAPSHR